MKKRCTPRESNAGQSCTRRWAPLYSRSADIRYLNIETRRNRGVLPPVIRGCSEPRWLRDA